MNNSVLSVDQLSVSLGSAAARVRPLGPVSLEVGRGEVVGLVGESGSGKSLTLRAAMGLLPAGASVDGGLTFHPKAGASVPARTARGRGIAMVFQEPMTALNPTMRVGDLVAAGVRQRTGMGRAAAQRRAVELLDAVGIPHPQRRARSWPHELSGGLRQRVVIAAALATDPELLLCDEPTTALDVTVQDQILQLIEGLRRDLGLSVLFVSHDLAVVARLCDRVLVMYAGQVVESGPAATVLGNPGHPYTRALLAAAPSLGRPAGPLVGIGGQPPDARAMPAGCRFAPRCAFAEPTCSATLPILEGPPLHQIACLRVDAVAGAR
ncbi:MAG: ABC transporter ATP-binding protein [Nostocoides sp.]|uniref:ABC transporter ATP-binding protein n=1 Tax=Nostocoides sp. TaxID=1917966 RepID=UPI003C71F1B2